MKTISVQDLSARLDQGGRIRLIDVLDREHYRKVHLPHAENIPLKELAELAPQHVEPGETVVVYCSSPDCSKSPTAAARLEELGYRDVYDFEGGIAEWRKGGLPLVRSHDASAA